MGGWWGFWGPTSSARGLVLLSTSGGFYFVLCRTLRLRATFFGAHSCDDDQGGDDWDDDHNGDGWMGSSCENAM